MNQGLASPESPSIQPTIDNIVEKIGGGDFWQNIIKNQELIARQTNLFLEVDQVAGFNSHFDFARETIDDQLLTELGAECLGWVALTDLHGHQLALGILPDRYKTNEALVDHFEKKIQHRAWAMLKRFNQARISFEKGAGDQNLFDIMRRGVKSHKSILSSLCLINRHRKSFPDDLIVPFGFWKEIREHGLFTQENMPFTDSIWELWELAEIQKSKKTSQEIAQEIAKFNDENVSSLQNRVAFTDRAEEKVRIEAYIDYFVKKAILPTPNRENPPALTIIDYGIGFGELAKFRIELLKEKGYNVVVKGIDVSNEVVTHFRQNPNPAITIYQMLFSDGPKNPELSNSADYSNSDWGTPQHAKTMEERLATDQAMNLCAKQGSPIGLNLTFDEGDMRQNMTVADYEATRAGNIRHMPGNVILKYPNGKGSIEIFVMPRELVLKSMRDSGFKIINLDPESFLPLNEGLPNPKYHVGKRVRYEVVAIKVSDLTESENVVSSLLALERFGAIAFPQMVKKEAQDTA